MRLKNILFKLGAITLTAAPISVAVACGKETKETDETTNSTKAIEKNNARNFPIAPADVKLIIDRKDMQYDDPEVRFDLWAKREEKVDSQGKIIEVNMTYSELTAQVRFENHDSNDALKSKMLNSLKSKYPNFNFEYKPADSNINDDIIRSGDQFVILEDNVQKAVVKFKVERKPEGKYNFTPLIMSKLPKIDGVSFSVKSATSNNAVVDVNFTGTRDVPIERDDISIMIQNQYKSDTIFAKALFDKIGNVGYLQDGDILTLSNYQVFEPMHIKFNVITKESKLNKFKKIEIEDFGEFENWKFDVHQSSETSAFVEMIDLDYSGYSTWFDDENGDPKKIEVVNNLQKIYPNASIEFKNGNVGHFSGEFTKFPLTIKRDGYSDMNIEMYTTRPNYRAVKKENLPELDGIRWEVLFENPVDGKIGLSQEIIAYREKVNAVWPISTDFLQAYVPMHQDSITFFHWQITNLYVQAVDFMGEGLPTSNAWASQFRPILEYFSSDTPGLIYHQPNTEVAYSRPIFSPHGLLISRNDGRTPYNSPSTSTMIIIPHPDEKEFSKTIAKEDNKQLPLYGEIFPELQKKLFWNYGNFGNISNGIYWTNSQVKSGGLENYSEEWKEEGKYFTKEQFIKELDYLFWDAQIDVLEYYEVPTNRPREFIDKINNEGFILPGASYVFRIKKDGYVPFYFEMSIST